MSKPREFLLSIDDRTEVNDRVHVVETGAQLGFPRSQWFHVREVTQQSEVDSLVLKKVRRLLMEMKNNGTKASDRFWEQINLCLDVIDGRPEGTANE